MKKLIALSAVIAAVFLISASLPDKHAADKAILQRISTSYLRELHRFDSFMASYPDYFPDSSHALRQRKYEELGYYFKRSITLFHYFKPDIYYKKLITPFQFERKAQGPPFPDSWLFIGPIGNDPDSVLQKVDKNDSLSLKMFITAASSNYREAIGSANMESILANMTMPDLFDALRSHMVKISTVDLANGDMVIFDLALPSLRGSTEGWLNLTGLLVESSSANSVLGKKWQQLAEGTRTFLARQRQWFDFDHMAFLRQHLIPLSQFLNILQQELDVPYSTRSKAWQNNLEHIYDGAVFNADYFSPGKDHHITQEKAKLGELLFFDPILSDNNRRACASCHKPDMAFTDGEIKSVSFEFDDLPRNSPTVINSTFQKTQFWDQRTGTLEDQLDSVINNKDELHSSFERVIDRINSSPEYIALFHQAFPESKTKGISKEQVKNAIAVYERTLVALNSRFDQYVRGDDSKMNQREIHGFNLYMGKARCGNCHFAPLYNGSLPPYYDISDHKAIGVPLRDSMEKYAIDPDIGFFKVSADSFTQFSFKTPTVRNIELTAPYMHNGVFKTLEQVIDFYEDGAGNKLFSLRTQTSGMPFLTILPDKLNLTDTEKSDLILFLKCLTDTASTSHKPLRLPELTGKYAHDNKRPIGGAY